MTPATNAKRMYVRYVAEDDVLYVAIDKPAPAVCDDDEDGILWRMSYESGELIGATVYEFLSRGKAVDHLLTKIADRLSFNVGAEYFEVETESVDLAEYLDADTMLETAEERAYEELGECAEDAFSVTKEAAEELDAALKAWAAKHLPRGYWKCVGKSQRLTVTAEDVAEYSRQEEPK